MQCNKKNAFYQDKSCIFLFLENSRCTTMTNFLDLSCITILHKLPHIFCYLAQVSRESSAHKDSSSITGLRFRHPLVKQPLENRENSQQLSSLVVETPDLFYHLQHQESVSVSSCMFLISTPDCHWCSMQKRSA